MSATGTLTVTSQSPGRGPVRPVSKFILAWTSDASGAVTQPTSYIGGEIQRVVFVPGAGGAQPTDSYDLTINDGSGIDILAGLGANLSNSSTTHVCPSVPMKDGTTTSTRPVAIDDILSVNITGAGNTKSGTIILYVR